MDSALVKSNVPRVALFGLLVIGAVVCALLGWHRYFTFGHLVANKDALIASADAHLWLAPLLFCTAYLVLGLCGLPGSTMLMLTAGLLFDFWKGLGLVALASTAASTLAFLSFRYLFRDFVERRVRGRLRQVEEGLRREGAYLVFAMRVLPAIPYSVTNLVLSVSPVRFGTYVVVSLLALLPRYALYVYAGTHLGDVRNPDDLFSPSLIAALALLAVLPWILRRVLGTKAKASQDASTSNRSARVE
jgi:uncharacterized membrane protein YdjX (TVP38/TMEM64 family)